jgi:WD40 repeat protein
MGSADGTVKVCEIPSLKQLASFQSHTHYVDSLFYVRTGELVTWSLEESSIIVWDVRTGRRQVKLKGYESPPVSDTKGDTLAALRQDGAIRLCALGTGKELASLKGSNSVLSLLAFSPDGTILASAGLKHDLKDGSVEVYKLATGKSQTVLRGEGFSGYIAVAFSPDGKTLATGGYKNVKLWDFAALLGKN